MSGLLFETELDDRGRRMVLDDLMADMSGAEMFRLARAGRLDEALGVRCEMLLEGVDDQALLMLDDRDRLALAGAVAAIS